MGNAYERGNRVLNLNTHATLISSTPKKGKGRITNPVREMSSIWDLIKKGKEKLEKKESHATDVEVLPSDSCLTD